MKKIKNYIRLYEGVRGNGYYVTKMGKNKMFKTLEAAEKYVKHLDMYAKERAFNYPHNLIDYLFCDNENVDIAYIEDNIEENLPLALESFTEREKDIFLKTWKDGYTLEAIGLQHGITRERVRQISAKVGRRLRHPSRLKILKYGKEVTDLQDDVAKLTMLLYKKKLELIHQIENPELITLTEEDKLEAISLEQLDLSVRSYNCLRRSGINKLVDLLTKTEEDLMRVRNLGRRSVKEIVDKLSSMGLSLKGFDTVKEMLEVDA